MFSWRVPLSNQACCGTYPITHQRKSLEYYNHHHHITSSPSLHIIHSRHHTITITTLWPALWTSSLSPSPIIHHPSHHPPITYNPSPSPSSSDTPFFQRWWWSPLCMPCHPLWHSTECSFHSPPHLRAMSVMMMSVEGDVMDARGYFDDDWWWVMVLVMMAMELWWWLQGDGEMLHLVMMHTHYHDELSWHHSQVDVGERSVLFAFPSKIGFV